ncbi:MAG: toll/interleukin-1 receptor domain-containing protein [Planctomycetes bacterium]|nr:toll/interleukin-1 receptor domain-containing protein [Planctomycetota bacterium]
MVPPATLRGVMGQKRLFPCYRTAEAPMALRLLEVVQVELGVATSTGASADDADVVLVLIGPKWLAVDPDRRRWVDDPRDATRREIEVALARAALGACVVLPLLVDNTAGPEAESLPESMHRLADTPWLRLQQLEWEGDVASILQRLLHLGFERRSVRQASGADGRDPAVQPPDAGDAATAPKLVNPEWVAGWWPFAAAFGVSVGVGAGAWVAGREVGLALAAVPMFGGALWAAQRGRPRLEVIEEVLIDPAKPLAAETPRAEADQPIALVPATMVRVPSGTSLMGSAATDSRAFGG